MRVVNVIAVFLIAGLIGGAIEAAPSAADPPVHGFKALIFSKTDGFRHDSIDEGIAAIQDMALAHSFEVDATEDAAIFSDSLLAGYDLVIFLNTTGDVLDGDQQAAFERFIRSGKGFVGVHSAADTEYAWSFYGELLGAYFESHPATQSGTVRVIDRVHPSTASLPEEWTRTDEWYNFQVNPRGDVHVLATLDESTYAGGNMGHDHPIAWCQPYEGGRSWYTAGGHTAESFSEAEFLDHLLNGIEWAAGAIEGDCSVTVDSSWEKAVLDDETDNPLALDVADDGRVFYVELGGAVKVYNPVSTSVTEAAELSVFVGNEHGLLGIALDPDFATNNWVYLFYSPSIGTMQRLSRFTVTGDVLDLSSEEILLEFPTDRGECCHNAGSMDFDADGNLYISTGDDTNPFESSGFTPIDERAGRAPWDAQRSSGSTADLRGKILRITPEDDGTYSIPSGNLFPDDGSAGRPEIYVMGVRNPFRISVDQSNGWLYWGDVGPDANADDGSRGPRGYDEWNQARAGGNYGWPYCIADNQAYVDYDFAAGLSSGAFDCANLVNDSPNNTGEALLPPASPAWIWYPYGPSAEFPAITDGSGRTAMAGPVYRYDDATVSDTGLPEYFDNTLLIYEWSRNWIHEVKLDATGDILAINPMLDGLTFQRPIDMSLGVDGSLYVIEWGSGFGGSNNDSRLVRVDYRPGGGTPVAVLEADPTSGPVPLTVNFSAANSTDPDSGTNLDYAWDFQNDGVIDATSATPSFTYDDPGVYSVRLTVTDPDSNVAVATTTITAGNTLPDVTVTAPLDGGFFEWGEDVFFEVSVNDAEDGSTDDGSIPCSAVVLQTSIGHDDHSHPLDQVTGCTGTFPVIEGHGTNGDDLFYVVDVSYTDQGLSGGPLTATTTHVLNPKRLEAEHYTINSGVAVEETGDTAGGRENIGFIDHGDYIAFEAIDLSNMEAVTYRVASAGTGGRIEMRLDDPDGQTISAAYVETTGNWQVYREVTSVMENPGGRHDAYFVFLNTPGSGGLFNVNWMEFTGVGVMDTTKYEPRGLSATYYNGPEFSGRTTERTDPKINFNWSSFEPLSFVNADNFSVRWIGEVEAEFDEAYTFYARTSDGVRVWLDGSLIIDQWVDRPVTETNSLLQTLSAGQRYDLVVEYYEALGDAQAHLSWSSLSTPKQIIPNDVLYPDATSTAIDGNDTQLPTRLTLDHVYPNPSGGTVTIEYRVSSPGQVRLQLFDTLGRKVVESSWPGRTAGRHQQQIQLSGQASGLYLLRIVDDSGAASWPLTLIR